MIRHESLLDRLHQLGLKGIWWRLKHSAYSDLKERVKWLGQLSEPFPVGQGSKQGAYPSPEDYVSHLCTLLFMTSKSNLGFHIGSINASTPTCADDMVMMANSIYQLQALLLLVSAFANEEHYVIHPQKSVILPFNIPSKTQLDHIMKEKPWMTNNKAITVEEEATHLGIRRNIHCPQAAVEDRTSSARKTFYSMMGSGLHGLNGLPVKTSTRLYNAYVIPRALYGLEAIRSTDTALDKLVKFHRYALRCMLGLPRWTAIPALHILSGLPPIEHMLDIRTLNFIHSLLTTDHVRDIVLRQYVMKTNKSSSLIIKFKEKLHKYQLPSITDLFINPPTKILWKRTVKQAVHKETSRYIEELAEDKSSLLYLNPQFFNSPHPSVLHVRNCRQVTRANVKIQLLSGTFPLYQTKHRMKKVPDDICPLCNLAPEDQKHFIEDCSALEPTRNIYKARLHALFAYNIEPFHAAYILDSRCLMEDHPQVDEVAMEMVSRDLLFALSNKRSSLIDSIT